MMRRIGMVLLCLLLVLSLVPVSGWAAQSPDQTCGENVFWYYEDGTLTITGTGAMMDFRYVDDNGSDALLPRPWDDFSHDIRRIVIEEGITYLGSDSFSYMVNLETVELPDTLTDIGNFAFWFCEALSAIELPQKLNSIGQQAFAFSSLKSVEIPSSVTFVDANAFNGCKSLTEVLFRSDPELLGFGRGNSVFADCTSLEEIQVEDGHIALVSIDGALYFSWERNVSMALSDYPASKKDKQISIADGTIFIDQFAIVNNPYVQTLILPDTLTEIKSNAIRYCEKLRHVIFNGNAPVVSPSAFYGCDVMIHHACGNESWAEARNSWDLESLAPGGSIAWGTYHTYDEGRVVIEPTTDAGGICIYTCTGCGTTKKEELPKLPVHTHEFGPWFIATESVLNGAEGTKYRVCQCGEKETVTYSNPLVDIPNGKYYTKPVFWAYENGITKGKTATEFQKDAECTRKQIVMFLWRAAGQPEPESMECNFDDVKNDSFRKAILWAVEKGITNGTSATKFSPDAPCTRKQIVMFLWRYFGKPELTQEQQKHEFTDMPGGQFRTAVLWALQNGITTGKTQTTFDPDGICTRGQIVTFLYRAMAES